MQWPSVIARRRVLSPDLETKLAALEAVVRVEQTPWNFEAEPLDLHAPVDGRYELVTQIGSGSQGGVFLATDLMPTNSAEGTVVLKILHHTLVEAEPDDRIRFLQEARLSLTVEHPHVITPHDIGIVAGRPYLAMRYIEGQSVADLLRRLGHLDAALARNVIGRLGAALQAIHELGIVHRDIKPQNVLLDERGLPYLVDFGIAFEVGAPRVTNPGLAVGSPGYMAPEISAGRAFDHRADVYSLAVLAYRIITGHFPYEAKTLQEMMYAHLHAVPDPPSKRRPTLPQAVDDVILRALSKAPEMRHQRIDYFAKEFDRALSEYASPAILIADRPLT